MNPMPSSFQPFDKDAKSFALPLPRPNFFQPHQNRHNSTPATSVLNISDLTDIWREDARLGSRCLDDQVQKFNQLSLNDTTSPIQPQPPFSQSWSESGLGLDKEWAWLDENVNYLSSSPASESSWASRARASQSPDPLASVGPQTWPSFPSWDMNATANGFHAADHQPQHVKQPQHFSATCDGLSPDHAYGSSVSLTSLLHSSLSSNLHHAYHKPQHGPNFRTPTPSISLPRSNGFSSDPHTGLDPYISAKTMTPAPIGTGMPSNAIPIKTRPSIRPTVADRFSFMQALPTQWESQYETSDHSSPSIFHNNPVGVQSMNTTPSSSYGKKDEPIEASRFNRKTWLYKTEMCRNWEEKGFCFYKERCQFAHGASELRPVERDPRWKTKPCKRFRLYGSCQYAKRCCFRHDQGFEEEQASSADRARRSSLLQRVGLMPNFDKSA